MPKKSASQFSGPLAEPIYEPSGGGLLGLSNEEERSHRIFERKFEKLFLLLRHYRIDKDSENCWIILSLCLSTDFVPGMKVKSSPPSRPGRKGTWKEGLGFVLLHDVAVVRKEMKLSISHAIEHLRQSEPKWRRFTPQNLVTRRREAQRESILRRKMIANLLSEQPPMSLAKLAEAYTAGQSERRKQLGGILGIGALASPTSGTDEN